MYISKLHLENFRCYDNFDIDFDEKLTVVVAENGKGKTAILDAVAVAMGPYLVNFQGVKTRNLSDVDVRQIQDSGGNGQVQVLRMKYKYPVVIKAEGVINGKKVAWERELKAAKGRTTIINAKPLTEYGKTMVKALNSTGDGNTILPILAYYGTSRMWNDSKLLELRKNINLGRSSGYIECLEPSSSYNTFGQWFKYAVMSALEYERYMKEAGVKEANPYDDVIYAVKEAIKTCIGSMGWNDIDYSFVAQNLIISHETLGMLPLDALSDGSRSVISMVADLAYRMVRLNPDLGKNTVLETPGIVLIDEVDMHLHPSWQQVVIQDLQKAFPKIQFIVTTHSPQVLTSVPADSIRILRWDNDNIIGAHIPEFSLGAESYQLLKEIQNVETRPKTLPIVKDLYRYLELVSEDKWDSDEAMALRERLDAWAKGREPALLRADMDIRMRAFRRKKE